MRKPRLDCRVIDSLDELLKKLPAGAVIGSPEELGVRYVSDLVKSWRSPQAVQQRQREAARTARHRKEHRAESA